MKGPLGSLLNVSLLLIATTVLTGAAERERATQQVEGVERGLGVLSAHEKLLQVPVALLSREASISHHVVEAGVHQLLKICSVVRAL